MSVWIALLLLFTVIAISNQLFAHAGIATESEVKAAFIYNFAKFVEWPPERLAGGSSSMRLCVFGDNPVYSELQQLAIGKTIGPRRLEVEQVELNQIRTCHILFIGSSDGAHLRQVLEAARGFSVLTVGDFSGFIDDGGMINLVFDQNRVRFEVNLKAAQEARLKLSSKLLNLAKSVQM